MVLSVGDVESDGPRKPRWVRAGTTLRERNDDAGTPCTQITGAPMPGAVRAGARPAPESWCRPAYHSSTTPWWAKTTADACTRLHSFCSSTYSPNCLTQTLSPPVHGLLFAPNSIAVSIKAVDVASDDNYRAHHIRRTISATAGTIDITGDRDAGTRVVRVT